MHYSFTVNPLREAKYKLLLAYTFSLASAFTVVPVAFNFCVIQNVLVFSAEFEILNTEVQLELLRHLRFSRKMHFLCTIQ